MDNLFASILNKLEIVDSLHEDVKALVAQCKVKQKDYNAQVVEWLKTVNPATPGIHYGHSRPSKWGLMHLVEFFDNPAYAESLEPNAIEASLAKHIGTVRVFSYEQMAKYYNEVSDADFLADERFLTTDPTVVGSDVSPSEQLSWELHLRDLARQIHVLKDYQFIWMGDFLDSTCYAALPHAYDVTVIAIPPTLIIPEHIKVHPFEKLDFSKLHKIIQECDPIEEDW